MIKMNIYVNFCECGSTFMFSYVNNADLILIYINNALTYLQ